MTEDQIRISESTRLIEGVYHCGRGFRVTFDCLKETFHATIAGQPIEITLPQGFNIAAFVPTLSEPVWVNTPTPQIRETHFSDEQNTWGFPTNWNTDTGSEGPGNAIVTRIRTAFMTVGDDTAIQIRNQGIVNAFSNLWALTNSWIEIAAEDDFIPSPRPSTSPNWVRFWTRMDNGEIGEVGGLTVLIKCDASRAIPLDPSRLQECLTLASEGIQPPIEWLLIRDARYFLYLRQWRRAVIDAGTASEVSITKMIDKRLTEIPERLKQKLMSDNQALKKRGEFLTLLDGTLPIKFQQRLIEPRNNASHEGADLTESEAHDAVKAAIEIVRSALPLANFFVYDDSQDFLPIPET
jgi:hypothetical protein